MIQKVVPQSNANQIFAQGTDANIIQAQYILECGKVSPELGELCTCSTPACPNAFVCFVDAVVLVPPLLLLTVWSGRWIVLVLILVLILVLLHVLLLLL